MRFNTKNIFRSAFILTVAILSFGQYSCLDKIDLAPPPGVEEALVIQGSIFKSTPSVIFVLVSELFDFTSNTLKPVNARLVEIIDEDGVVLEIPEAGLGRYQIKIPDGFPDFSVEFGKSYQLHVETRDGREYFTNYEPLYDVPEPDSLSMEVFVATVVAADGTLTTKDKVRVSVYTSTVLPGMEEAARLKWGVERTYKVTDSPPSVFDTSKVCYLTENVVGANLQVVDGNDRTSDRIDDFGLYESTITSAFGEGMYVHVYQQSISAGAFEYWRQVQLLIERSGNMFEPPAGRISTNLSNPNDPEDDVFGYFYCYTQDTIRIYIDPESVMSPPPSCPPPGGVLNEAGDCAVAVCCDCESHLRSDLSKPEYWTE